MATNHNCLLTRWQNESITTADPSVLLRDCSSRCSVLICVLSMITFCILILSHSGVATGRGGANGGNCPPPTLSRIDPEISTNLMRNNHNWCMGVATSTIDLNDSDWYFDLCKTNQNHCNQNVFWSQNMAKMLWSPGFRPRPRWGACSAPLDS